MSIFHLTFPKFQKNFTKNNVAFSIGNIKSRTPTVAYFILHCYNYQGNEILVNNKPFYIGNRFVITPSYRSYVDSFEIDEETLSQTYKLEIELVLFGVTSENPCWFNNVMFESGEHTEYHKPNDALDESDVYFNNNNYVVLYTANGNGLQVIRPNKDPITTKTLTKSKFTLLAPHLSVEPITDTHSKLMMEFINQTEQWIQIKK